MKQPLTVSVRRANAQGSVELIIGPDQTVSFYRDRHSAISAGFTISLEKPKPNGRRSAGAAGVPAGIAISTFSGNGQARVSR